MHPKPPRWFIRVPNSILSPVISSVVLWIALDAILILSIHVHTWYHTCSHSSHMCAHSLFLKAPPCGPSLTLNYSAGMTSIDRTWPMWKRASQGLCQKNYRPKEPPVGSASCQICMISQNQGRLTKVICSCSILNTKPRGIWSSAMDSSTCHLDTIHPCPHMIPHMLTQLFMCAHSLFQGTTMWPQFDT